jgi:hypothetical protein
MNHRMMLVVLALIMLTLTGTACQKGEKEEPQAMVEVEEWVLPDSLLSEQVWLYFTDKPEEYFQQTISDLDLDRSGPAAHDLRTAAAYLKIEAARGRGQSKKALKAAIDGLERAAGQIEDGVGIQTTDMETMFARAHYALAEHHYDRATALWKRKDEIKAGEELDVSATHVEHGMGWVTETPDQARISALKRIREAAGEMTEGKLMKPEAVSKAMAALGDEITELRTKLEPAG